MAGPRDAGFAVVATTQEVLAHPGLDEALLAPWERQRLARIRVRERRREVVAARLLLRLCVARHTGLTLRASEPAQLCPGCGRTGHGRPYLPGRPGLGLSMSHADGLVAAAVAPGAVGIDVEPSARRPGPPHMLRRFLPESELREAASRTDPGSALLRSWVRREAVLKAGQDGLRLLEWSDPERAATAAVAAAAPITVRTCGGDAVGIGRTRG
ncbi:4'-phosphopantetheinyl transferase superfamily protein [Streptomyces sp. NPDC002104]